MAKEKLVRDKMPELCETTPGWSKMNHRIVNNSVEHLALLKDKLTEEVNEVLAIKGPIFHDSTKYKMTEELADLFEVALCVAAFHGITSQEIENVRRNKEQHRGSFMVGIVWDGKK